MFEKLLKLIIEDCFVNVGLTTYDTIVDKERANLLLKDKNYLEFINNIENEKQIKRNVKTRIHESSNQNIITVFIKYYNFSKKYMSICTFTIFW